MTIVRARVCVRWEEGPRRQTEQQGKREKKNWGRRAPLLWHSTRSLLLSYLQRIWRQIWFREVNFPFFLFQNWSQLQLTVLLFYYHSGVMFLFYGLLCANNTHTTFFLFEYHRRWLTIKLWVTCYSSLHPSVLSLQNRYLHNNECHSKTAVDNINYNAMHKNIVIP